MPHVNFPSASAYIALTIFLTHLPQVNVLFDDTVIGNITVGLESSKVPHDDAAVKEACLTAQLWHDIPSLGGGLGLQAPVGYRGKFISGGLAQRICLARCLMRRTPLLFLDEPVSSQDDRMVQDLSEALGELKVRLTWDVRTCTRAHEDSG